MHVSMILNPDTCMYDACIYVPRSLPWSMHLCMMYISMILDPDTCIYDAYICSSILDYDACVYDAHIYDSGPDLEACMYVWCMYLWCGKFCQQPTDGRTDKAILGVWFYLMALHGIVSMGLSCKIGNIPVPGTSENQNCQFYEIHHFSLIFTFLYYIVTLKHIRQSYCSDNQHVVAYQWKSMSQGQTEKCTACLARKKYFFCKDKV